MKTIEEKMDITQESNEVVEEAVDQMSLEEQQKQVVLGVFEWVKRMNEKHGNTVYSISGELFDWGQALCREQFGEDWQNYMISNNILMPTQEDLDRAIRWEEGEVPEWVRSNET